MGFFSRGTDDLLQDSTDTGRAAYAAARDGDTAVGAAYKAQSDESFQQWLGQTQHEWEQRQGS